MRTCKCGSKADIDAMEIRDAPAKWQALEAYYCLWCGFISHAVQPEEQPVYGPINASAPLGVRGGANGVWETTWALKDGTRAICIDFKPYPRRSMTMVDQGREYLLSVWRLLDTKVEIIMAPATGHGDNELVAEARNEAKLQARGVAETIAILMSGYYETPDAVVREAVARYKASQAETEHQTPGLAEQIWDPATRPVHATPPPTDKPRATRTKTEKVLKPDEIEGIKNGVSLGVFDEAKAAQIFGCSVEQVKKIVAS